MSSFFLCFVQLILHVFLLLRIRISLSKACMILDLQWCVREHTVSGIARLFDRYGVFRSCNTEVNFVQVELAMSRM